MSFKVKALFPYSSEHDDDLSFPEGQIITVTEEEDDDWYTGEYTDEASGKHHQGLFPRNFVERYEPVAPPRPARRPQAAAPIPQPEPVAEAELEPEPQPVPAAEPKSPVTQTKSPDPVTAEPDDVEEEEESEEEEAAPPPTLATKPPPPPREEPQQSVPAPAPRAVPPPAAPVATKPPPPPAASAADSTTKPDVAEKPIGSFRDRIAAFNRGGAAPVAPPKPGGFSGGSGSSGFIRKPYVAPPPSRNAYVPPATQAPVARIYRREEDPELKSQDDAERAPPPPPLEKSEESEEDQPKPMSLKERMAMLQKQQLEQQARHAEAASKKAKPKPPPKKTSTSSQPPIPSASPETAPEVAEPVIPTRVLSNDSTQPEVVTSPEHEIDEPAAMHDVESKDIPRAAAPPPVPTNLHPQKPAADEVEEEEEGEKEEGDNEAEGEEEEEEMDPEIRRRMEIRERMAKMSGGMGMGAMFGGGPGLPGMGARKPPRSRPSDPSAESEEVAESRPAPPVPVMPGMAMPGMALPGTGVPRPKKQATADVPEVEKEDDEPERGSISARSAAEVSDVEDLKEQPESEDERGKEPARVVPPPPEVRQAPPVPPTAERSQRPSVASSGSTAAERPQFVPPIPQRAPEHTSERTAPPLPPSQVTSPPLPPTSPPRRSTDNKRMSQGPDGAGGYSRAPPPPPPSQPPRQSMEVSRPDESDEEEEDDESEEDEPTGRRSDELHHAGLPSLGPGSQTRAPPPPPPGQASAPRGVPPPPPSQPPRHSIELPRAPPPVPVPARLPPQDEDYDPYNYTSNPMGVPTPTGSTANTPRVEVQHNDLYDSDPPTSPSARAPPPIPTQAPPAQAAPPVPPPSQPPPSQAAPPPPPAPAPQVIPPQSPPQLPPQAPPPQMPSGMSPLAPQDTRKSLDVLNRSSTRRSMDVSRPSGENYEYIASDIDLGRDSNWWAHRRSPPPAFQNRSDVSIEYDESNTVQNDGRALTAKHVYALFMDYSQTIVTAYFSPENPAGGVEFQQRHEPPPAQLRQDQLEAAHEQFGAQIAQAAKGKENHAVADGSAFAFVNELVKALPGALMPVGNRAFGALVYANMANTTITSHDEIRAGDILTFRKAKLQGHRGGLKQKYSIELASHAGIVLDWDGTKHKVRIYEQNGKKVKVESYKLDDLKTGEAKVWRVMSREWVGWGSTN